jgi:hypothetical protein
VQHNSIRTAFQEGECRINFNYRALSWLFMFVNVRNVYEVMNEADVALHTPTIIFDISVPRECQHMYYEDIARVMNGDPLMVGKMVRSMWDTSETLSSSFKHSDLSLTRPRRFNLLIFDRV